MNRLWSEYRHVRLMPAALSAVPLKLSSLCLICHMPAPQALNFPPSLSGFPLCLCNPPLWSRCGSSKADLHDGACGTIRYHPGLWGWHLCSTCLTAVSAHFRPQHHTAIASDSLRHVRHHCRSTCCIWDVTQAHTSPQLQIICFFV